MLFEEMQHLAEELLITGMHDVKFYIIVADIYAEDVA